MDETEFVAQFNVHEAKTQFSQLLDMVERGEEVIVARNGTPVAKLIPVPARRFAIGAGVGEPGYRYGASDEESFAPLTDEEGEDFVAGRL